MFRLRRKIALAWRHGPLLAYCTLLVAIVRIALTVSGHQAVLRRVATSRASPRKPANIHLAIWAIHHAARLVPRATCLTKALAGHYMCTRAGHPTRVRIGVRRAPDGSMAAHAWLVDDDVVLIGGQEEDLSSFTPARRPAGCRTVSGLAGLFRLDGGPVAQSGLAAAEAALPARLRFEWDRSDDRVLGASFPIAGGNDPSDVVVAADVRLDNRADLIDALGIRGPIGDAALIAAAYHRWSGDCPTRLEGDFAFILHDRRRGIILCARDHFGVRPFYYHLDDRLFAAASTPRFLTALPSIGDETDEAGIADLVAGGYADREVTIHRGVRRLPPGHALLITGRSAQTIRFWHPGEVATVEQRDAPEAFRALFRDAVDRRLSGYRRAGAMLSGGLDSSAVALQALANFKATERVLPTLSLMLDDMAGWNERPFIEAVLEQGGFQPCFIPADDHDPLAELPALIEEQDGPFVAYNATLSRGLYRRARAEGIGLLLDGHGGDEVVSHGIGRLNELAARGAWLDLWREGAGIAGIYGASRWQIVSPYLSHNRYVRRARARFGGASAIVATEMLVAPALAARSGLVDRPAPAPMRRSARHSEADLHVEALSSPQQAYAFEVLDRMAGAAGVVSRYPFYDLRLVRFCLSLPSHEKLGGGLPRRVLRQAMTGTMPDKVRLRLDKYDFAPALAAGMLRRRDMLDDIVRKDRAGVSRFVDMDVAGAALDRLAERGAAVDGQALFALWRTAMLSIWLDRRGFDVERWSGSRPQEAAI